MVLPMNDSKLPFDGWRDIYLKYQEYAAWYSGDIDRITSFYRENYSKNDRFFASDRKDKVLLPIVNEMARLSADLLFSEEPETTFENDETAKRFKEISDRNMLLSRLLESAETQSPMSGVFLKINYDVDNYNYPILSIAQPDNAFPEFEYNRLRAVTFFKDVTPIKDLDKTKRYWLIERQERGIIENGLYEGTQNSLGKKISLDSLEATKGIEESIDTEIDDILVRYIPNMLPNPLWRGTDIGQSDFAQAITLIETLCETYSDWRRDLELAKGRVIVPEQWLERSDDGTFKFDKDQDLFTTLDIDPLAAKGTGGFTVAQFDIRSQQYRETAQNLLEQIVYAAGYSPQSFGFKGEGNAMTATEVKAKENRTYKTLSKKQQYWKVALEDIFYLMLQVDSIHIKSGVSPERPKVELADSIDTDMKALAETVDLINRADAASTKVKVKLLHPDWTEEQIDEEVYRIDLANGSVVPDPTQVGRA